MKRRYPSWYIKFGAFKHVTSVGDLMCDLDETLKHLYGMVNKRACTFYI
jgi:hypothetical protein